MRKLFYHLIHVDDAVSGARGGGRLGATSEGGAVDDTKGTCAKLLDKLETAVVDGVTGEVGDGGAPLGGNHDDKSCKERCE